MSFIHLNQFSFQNEHFSVIGSIRQKSVILTIRQPQNKSIIFLGRLVVL